jgi:hypothetical protein
VTAAARAALWKLRAPHVVCGDRPVTYEKSSRRAPATRRPILKPSPSATRESVKFQRQGLSGWRGGSTLLEGRLRPSSPLICG